MEDRGIQRLEEARYREALGHFATGVTVVTTLDDDGPSGFTCQAFAALSLDPPLVVFAPAVDSRSWVRIRTRGLFCINVLAEEQEAVARVFAGKGDTKFSGVGWQQGSWGLPLLDDAVAWIECRLDAVHPGGDHALAVGFVLDVRVGNARPLLFFRGGYGGFRI